MGKWLEALRAIDKQDDKEPAKPAKVPFDPFAGSILERFAREKTPSHAEVHKIDATHTSTKEPAKPAKGPFDPFAGSPLMCSACQKTRSEAETEQFEIANAPTNQPAKPAKVPFDPFAGAARNETHHKTVESRADRAPHESPNAPITAPAKGPADAEIHSDRHPATKNTATGNAVAKPCGPATTPEPEPPWLACGCCGARKWWWDGRGAWCCNQCMADVGGNGGHPITGKEVMRLVVR